MNEEYIIAIPSYQRPDTFMKRTFPLLLKYQIDPTKIFIFVASKEEKRIYELALEGYQYNKIIVGEVGIKNQRNFMANYFPMKTKIFYIDDDIYEINECINLFDKSNKKHNVLQTLDSLHNFIEEGFKQLELNQCSLFGVYVVNNPYFMKASQTDFKSYTSTKLNYIMGGFCGVINNQIAEVRSVDDKEDYERSIKYYLIDGKVLRFNNISFKTKCYKEPGGMQFDGQRTKQRIHDSAVYLVNKYPNLCSLNLSKKSGYSEIRLCDKKKKMKRDFLI